MRKGDMPLMVGKDVKIISWSLKMVQKTHRESGNLDSPIGRAVDRQSKDTV
jgi:hypothetical protein